MADPKHLRARASRDRLIDLLGFGETFPLRDVNVRGERLKVPFETAAYVPIETSQRDVEYALQDPRSGAVIERPEGDGTVPVRAFGNDNTLRLKTPPILEDRTYSILATKAARHHADDEALEPRSAYLHEQATVRVGLDAGLHARILLPRLEPAIENPRDEDARLAFYGDQVVVQIDASQEGVFYSLVDADNPDSQELSQSDALGDRHQIELVTTPVTEDVDIAIRAQRRFVDGDGPQHQETLLDTVLPLRVRANPTAGVAVTSASIVDFGADATIRISPAQRSVAYQLYARGIRDHEFLFNDESGPDELAVEESPQVRARVRRPERRPTWHDIPGFVAVQAPQASTGSAVNLTADGLTFDVVAVVRARKKHRSGRLGEASAPIVESAVQLEQAHMVLVQPNANVALRLTAWFDGAQTTGVLRVENGQPGVFYLLLAESPTGPALARPAYFHQRDDRDPMLNKGLGQMRLEIDAVVAPTRASPLVGRGPLGSTKPLSPVLQTGPLPAGTTLHAKATKAHTGVTVRLLNFAELPGVPVISAAEPVVAAGTPGRLVVTQSLRNERYWVERNGEILGAEQEGNGTDLFFDTPPIDGSTTFEVVVARSEEAGLPVRRVVRVTLNVTEG